MAIVAFVALAPVVALLVWIYLKDAYEPEPRAFVMKVALAGGILVVGAAGLEALLSSWLPSSRTVESFITTGLTEELVKFAGAMLVFYRSRHFNEEMDGIVYSSSLALGFAAVENVLYVMQSGLESGYVRALLPVPGHAFFGVVMVALKPRETVWSLPVADSRPWAEAVRTVAPPEAVELTGIAV